MALKSTIFKAELHLSDMGRNYYAEHNVTIARHPSENDERMMVRLLAFALHADDRLEFGESIGNEDEPSLRLTDMTGALKLWIDVGQPEEKRIRKACGRAQAVYIYSYGGHCADVWFRTIKSSFERTRNLFVVSLPQNAPAALASLAQRSMKLQITVQDGQVWLTDDRQQTVHLDLSGATVLSPAQ